MITEINPKDIWFINDPLKWCGLAYPGHKHCPNIGSSRKLDGILPELKPWVIRECPNWDREYNLVFGDIFDVKRPLYLIATKYPVGQDALQRKEKHPDLTLGYWYNIRYWQGKARRLLIGEVTNFLQNDADLITRRRFGDMTNEERNKYTVVNICPEGNGLSLVKAAEGAGINLKFKDWPPKVFDPELVKYQMAIGGYPKDVEMLISRGILGRRK